MGKSILSGLKGNIKFKVSQPNLPNRKRNKNNKDKESSADGMASPTRFAGLLNPGIMSPGDSASKMGKSTSRQRIGVGTFNEMLQKNAKKKKQKKKKAARRNRNAKMLMKDDLTSKETEIDLAQVHIPEEELDLADEFLSKFTIVSESSLNQHIDIHLVMKALPGKIQEENFHHAELFLLELFQNSLIAFQNQDTAKAFEYFDEKNRDRVFLVKEKIKD